MNTLLVLTNLPDQATAETLAAALVDSEARYPALQAAIRAGHPYATPEIIAIPVTRGLPDYLAWVAMATQAES
jgi:periplasmic divalent cation tolerance protein